MELGRKSGCTCAEAASRGRAGFLGSGAAGGRRGCRGRARRARSAMTLIRATVWIRKDPGASSVAVHTRAKAMSRAANMTARKV